MFQHIAQHCDNAALVKFVNCDGGECELLEAVHEHDGSWSFHSDGPAAADMWNQRSEVIMMEMEYTE